MVKDKNILSGVPVVVQWKQIPLVTMRLSVQYLALLSGLRSHVAVSCDVGHRHGLDPALPWLWRRLAVAAPIQPLAWEPPYAAGAALKKRQKSKKKNFIPFYNSLRDNTWWYLINTDIHF